MEGEKWNILTLGVIKVKTIKLQNLNSLFNLKSLRKMIIYTVTQLKLIKYELYFYHKIIKLFFFNKIVLYY